MFMEFVHRIPRSCLGPGCHRTHGRRQCHCGPINERHMRTDGTAVASGGLTVVSSATHGGVVAWRHEAPAEASRPSARMGAFVALCVPRHHHRRDGLRTGLLVLGRLRRREHRPHQPLLPRADGRCALVHGEDADQSLAPADPRWGLLRIPRRGCAHPSPLRGWAAPPPGRDVRGVARGGCVRGLPLRGAQAAAGPPCDGARWPCGCHGRLLGHLGDRLGDARSDRREPGRR